MPSKRISVFQTFVEARIPKEAKPSNVLLTIWDMRKHKVQNNQSHGLNTISLRGSTFLCPDLPSSLHGRRFSAGKCLDGFSFTQNRGLYYNEKFTMFTMNITSETTNTILYTSQMHQDSLKIRTSSERLAGIDPKLWMINQLDVASIGHDIFSRMKRATLDLQVIVEHVLKLSEGLGRTGRTGKKMIQRIQRTFRVTMCHL